MLIAGILLWLVAGVGSTLPVAKENPAAVEPRAAATVNGEVITLDDLTERLGELHSAAQVGERRAFDLDRLMFRVVNDVLLGQEARALGMDREESIVEAVSKRRLQLARQELERREIAERIRITEDEVYQAFEEQYRAVTLRVVTAYERQGAEDLLADLHRGADMDQLARERSVDPYAPRGGLVKSIAWVDLPREIAELAFEIKPGALGGPIRTDLGWSLIRVEAHHKADPERFAGLQRTLHELIAHRQRTALRSALAERARQDHAVAIDQDVVDGVRPERLPDGRLMPRVEDPSAVVARVGEQGISAAEYGKALQGRWSGVRNEEAAIASAPIILRRMIDERLLLAVALARGYGELPEVKRTVRAFETQLIIPRYLEEIVAAGVEVSREEMASYYEAHQAEFTKPPRLRLGQITVRTPEEAERVAGLLRAGTDLAWLARQHSIDRFKSSGGDRGWIELGTDELSERLAGAKIGDVVDPFGSPGNYVVLKVTAWQEQGSYAFEEVSGNVRNAVYSRKLQETLEAFMEKLRSRSEIEIDQDLLATLRVTGTVPGEADPEVTSIEN